MDEASRVHILQVLDRQEQWGQAFLACIAEIRERVLAGASVSELKARLAEIEQALGVDVAE